MKQKEMKGITKGKFFKTAFSLTPSEYESFQLLYQELGKRRIVRLKKDVLMVLVYIGLQRLDDKEFWKEAVTAVWEI